MALLGILGFGALFILLVLVYELARARVPQHRAALEHLVRVQTGLDVRFTELGLRWGWYGPEAVFKDVELDEPGTAVALLRAPELVVGFDAWRTLRSGHPEAGRIELVAPEIDFASARDHRGIGGSNESLASRPAGIAPASSPLERVAVLQRWRGGRIDIDGGTLRLPDPSGNDRPLSLQVRRASLRRTDDEWTVAGLMFLPDGVGRGARVTLRVNGDLGVPTTLRGSLHVESRRLQFPGVHELLSGVEGIAPAIPDAGTGDVTMDLEFRAGRVSNMKGTLRSGGLAFDSPMRPRLLVLDRLQAGWRATRVPTGWRVRVSSRDAVSGTLAGVQLGAAIRELTFDWRPGEPPGDRLRTSGRLENVWLSPRSHQFSFGGLMVQVSGNESRLQLDVKSRTATLDWLQPEEIPYSDVRVSSIVRFSVAPEGWMLSTDELMLEHQRASMTLSGSLQGSRVTADAPRIAANGTLNGVDIPLVMRLIGDDTAQAFGAVASRLSSGRIQSGEFALQGPVSELPFAQAGGFRGSLALRAATLSGGDLWPDAQGIDARVEWHGARIQATIDAGRAGPFQLAAAKAEWDATGAAPTRVTGHVDGRIEDALAWVRDHPRLREFTPDIRDIDADGDATFDFNVSIPPNPDSNGRRSQVVARVSTFVNDVNVQVVPGLPPLSGVTGSFVFDSGRVQRSVLTGSWLGGPLTLRIGERKEKGARVLSVQAQGSLRSEELAAVANATGTVAGATDWSGELSYQQPSPQFNESGPPRWLMRADSNLLGVSSSLPEPFAKQPGAVVPAHLEVAGAGNSALLKANLGDRLRSLFALQRPSEAGWRVDRGAVRFGGAAAVLPLEPVVLLRGRLGKLDLPAYALAWQRLRKDSLPAIRAQLAADQMLVGGRRFDDVSLRADHTATGTDLLIDAAQLAGMGRWPAAPVARPGESVAQQQPAELHLTRLDLQDGAVPAEGVGLAAALAPSAVLSVDELNWRGRSLGRLTADVAVRDSLVVVDDLRLVNGAHQAHGTLRCQTAAPECQLRFVVESSDAATTLADFGWLPDVTAASASLSGDLLWRPAPDRSWLAALRGTLSMHLADGVLRPWEGERGSGESSRPFALLAVPALVRGLDAAGAAGVALKEPRDLHFASLEADFELRDGDAVTSNLHFDGDAEILMRGRTGLVARDYDQQAWVLRGEERLPAPVRRFGATPRVAAAWLSLRDLFSGSEEKDPSRAVLRLQGSWDDPMVGVGN